MLQAPCRYIAPSREPHAFMRLGVLKALTDDRLQRRPAADVAVKRNLNPFRRPGLALGVECIECEKMAYFSAQEAQKPDLA
jgi:hypothetical protein